MAKLNPNIGNRKAQASKNIAELTERICAGDRFALSKGITLLESENPADQENALKLLSNLLPSKKSAFRIGISGAPGSGKSTLIESLGLFLIEQGKRPAILAIDPSSSKTGGSILGDKTRMHKLSQSEEAFIRPSPAGSTLGGVARKTRECIILLEAAGFDPVIIETVGVGQSETAVKSMTDLFVLLIAPGAGDEIQGIKRGIMELADIVVINKMDGQLKSQAEETKHSYEQSLKLMPQFDTWRSRIVATSGIENKGIKELWEEMLNFFEHRSEDNSIVKRRKKQNIAWFEDHIRESFFDQILHNKVLRENYLNLSSDVEQEKITPYFAAQKFIDFLKHTNVTN